MWGPTRLSWGRTIWAAHTDRGRFHPALAWVCALRYTQRMATLDAAPTAPAQPAQLDIDGVAGLARALIDNIALAYVGQTEAVELVVVALLADGHLLIEDLPGIGKTTLVKAMARSIDGWYSRIQFTPDLEPADITGAYSFNQKSQTFVFRNGPLVANILLADEINRAAPRTQSALLEAMQERQYTVDGETRFLPTPFLVCATQNPIERQGTFPLPEAQLDRFLLRIHLGYPSAADEDALLTRYQVHDALFGLSTVTTAEAIASGQQIVRKVVVDAETRRYLLDVVRATRNDARVSLGASPRATMALYRAAQAFAAMQGRMRVLPADVCYLARAVLSHRIHTVPGAPPPATLIAELAAQWLTTQ